MNYYIWNVPCQIFSEVLESDMSFEEIRDSLSPEIYGLRQITREEYLDEIEYIDSKR